MKISKQQLIDMKACEDVLERFIEQTNNTDELVDVLSLIGGKNTVYDLVWLAGETLPKEKLVRFACDLALINIEKIKLYTEKYDLIVEFLMNPTADSVAIYAAIYAVYAARVTADDAANAAAARVALYAAADADAVYAADDADTVYAALYATAAAVRAGATQDQIDVQLVKMFDGDNL